MMRVADWIMKRLADEGLRHMFLLPGGGAMHLNDALHCEPRITPVPCHHEQACGISAEAYGRIGKHKTLDFGAVLVTTGPGATNLITPVAGAWIDSIPLFVISGQVKRPDRLNGRPLRQSGVQEVDIMSMVGGITKYATTFEDLNLIQEQFETALMLMRSGRPGPVWIEIPLDIQGASFHPASVKPHTDLSCSSLPQYSENQISRIVSLLTRSKRPLILAGHGIRLSGAADCFRKLINQLQVPVVSTWNALDLIPYDNPLYVGTPGVVALRAPNFAIQNCDLLLSIGCRLDNVVTAYNQSNFAKSAVKIVVDIDKEELGKEHIYADEMVHLNAKDFIDILSETVSNSFISHASAWVLKCRDWKERYSSNNEKREYIPGVISHYQLVDCLSSLIPENTLIATGSSGLAIEAFYSTFRTKPGQRLFLTSGLGSMGYGLSASIGGCLGNDKKHTILIESDGSFMLNLQELATLKSLVLPIKIIIFDNNGYASIRSTQRNYFDGRYIASGINSGLYIPDLASVAESFGLSSIILSCPETLGSDLNDFLITPGQGVCVVKLASAEVLTPKVSTLPQSDGSIISMPLEDMSPLLDYTTLESEMIGKPDSLSLTARQ